MRETSWSERLASLCFAERLDLVCNRASTADLLRRPTVTGDHQRAWPPEPMVFASGSVSGIECRRFTADRNMVILVSPWAEMVASNEVRVTG